MQHLVLLHGALGSSGDLLHFRNRLQDRYILHLFDFPGHGLLSSPDSGFGIPAFASSLDTYCKALGQSPMVFGYSMGGYVALYAAAILQTPISSIITLGTKYAWETTSAEKEASFLDADRISTQFPDWARQLEKAHGKRWTDVLKNTALMIKSLGNKPLLGEDQLKNISFPVTVLRGEKDRMVSAEESKLLADHLPQGRFFELPAQQHPLDRVEMDLLMPYFNEGFAKAGSSA